MWYVVAGILFAGALGLMGYQYVRERRYLRKKTSEAMGKELWQEIASEREESERRRDHFKHALREAREGPPRDDDVHRSTFS